MPIGPSHDLSMQMSTAGFQHRDEGYLHMVMRSFTYPAPHPGVFPEPRSWPYANFMLMSPGPRSRYVKERRAALAVRSQED